MEEKKILERLILELKGPVLREPRIRHECKGNPAHEGPEGYKINKPPSENIRGEQGIINIEVVNPSSFLSQTSILYLDMTLREAEVLYINDKYA